MSCYHNYSLIIFMSKFNNVPWQWTDFYPPLQQHKLQIPFELLFPIQELHCGQESLKVVYSPD